jgi:hypothetical protein
VITIFGTYRGVSVVIRKALDWKCYRISVSEVETVVFLKPILV